MHKKALLVIIGVSTVVNAHGASLLGRLTPSPTNVSAKKLTPPATENPFPYVVTELENQEDAELELNLSEEMLSKIVLGMNVSTNPINIVCKVTSSQNAPLDNKNVSPEVWKQAFGMSFAARSKHLLAQANTHINKLKTTKHSV